MTWVRALFGLITGSRQTIVLTMLVVAAGSLWAWAATEHAKLERWNDWAEKTCLAAGSAWPGKGAAGADCTARIARLAAFERDALARSNALLADAAREQVKKSAADTALDRSQAQRLAAALARMETANAAVAQDDHVGPDWFARLNDVAGLRAPH